MTLLRTATSRQIVSPQMTTTLLAPSSQTGGDFGLFDVLLPGSSPGAVPHRHQGFSESFYVLDGTLAVRSEDSWSLASPGDLLHVPRRGLHAFKPEDGDVRFLLLFTPGTAREAYFAEMAELALREEPASEHEIDEIARRHDQVNVRDE